ncbi:proline-rich transmembrane protein 1-like [Lytechinus variegatus]|uniref:proline-rich transmembrane protein 1-like n=1 Tax=Lytechinus variegatus TaxID=7654 RepID=UPI001BB2742C|nr:proline-rich transmembrane protein 1-like [Lytechinus variegatus]
MSAPYPDKAQEAAYPPQQPAGYAPVTQNPGYPPQGYPPQGAPPAYPQGQAQAQYGGGQNVIVATAPQTTMIVRQSQPQPNDYLAFAIFVTICCCLPFGIVGIVKAMDVRNRYTAGDMAGAEESSRSAKNWSMAGLIVGIVLEVIGIILIVVYYVVILAAVSSSYDIYG